MQRNPDVDLVLMDIMMPEMDGFEATRAIRDIEKLLSLLRIWIPARRGAPR